MFKVLHDSRSCSHRRALLAATVRTAGRRVHGSALLPPVPVAHCLELLERCASVYVQAQTPLELVVRFDGGRAGPSSVLKALAEAHPERSSLLRGQLGAGAAVFLRPDRKSRIGVLKARSDPLPPRSDAVWLGGAAIGGGSLAVSTSNTAEYIALAEGLRAALTLMSVEGGALRALAAAGKLTGVVIEGDSKLVIEQLAGEWAVKASHLAPLRALTAHCVRALAQAAGLPPGSHKLRHESRSKNTLCDALARASIAYGNVQSLDPRLANAALLGILSSSCTHAGLDLAAALASAEAKEVIPRGAERDVTGHAVASATLAGVAAAERSFLADFCKTPSDQVHPVWYVTRIEPWLEAGRLVGSEGEGEGGILHKLGIIPSLLPSTLRAGKTRNAVAGVELCGVDTATAPTASAGAGRGDVPAPGDASRQSLYSLSVSRTRSDSPLWPRGGGGEGDPPALRLQVRVSRQPSQDNVRLQYEVCAIDCGRGRGDASSPSASGELTYANSPDGLTAALGECAHSLMHKDVPGLRAHADAPLYLALLFGLQSAASEVSKACHAAAPGRAPPSGTLRVRVEVPSERALQYVRGVRLPVRKPETGVWVGAVRAAAAKLGAELMKAMGQRGAGEEAPLAFTESKGQGEWSELVVFVGTPATSKQ